MIDHSRELRQSPGSKDRSGGAWSIGCGRSSARIFQESRENPRRRKNMEPIKSRKKKHPEFDEHYTKLSSTKKRCKFCDKEITGPSITRIKCHWAGLKGRDVLPCQNVPDSVRKAATLDINNWESRKGKNQITNEVPSHTHRIMAAALTSTKPYNDEDTTASMKRAVQKWFYFNRISYSCFFTAEFHQFCEAIVASNRASSSYVRPPLTLIDEKDILTDLENEIADYVQTIRGSWSSTHGCTICVGRLFDGDGDNGILLPIVRCPQGTIYLKQGLKDININSDEAALEAMSKDFLDSVIEDVGLDNIKQILLPRHDHLFMNNINYSTNIRKLFSRDLVETLLDAYIGLATIREQCSIYISCYGDLNVALVLSMMLKEKQKIDGLLGEMQESTITKLSFWNSEKTYDDVCTVINLMYRTAGKDEYAFLAFDALNQGREKHDVCKLIKNIIASDDIFPNSLFWNSVETYVCLYKHIRTTLRRIGNDGFTFENYLVAYVEAKTIIRKEYFQEKDYIYLIDRLDDLLPCSGDEVVCYLCPHIRQYIVSIDVKFEMEKRRIQIMETRANEIDFEDAYYGETDNTFSKEVWSPAETIDHTKAWWEKQRDIFPHEHKLAIEAMSGICSNDHIWRVVEYMYETMWNEEIGDVGELHHLLHMRLNNHFKHFVKPGQGDDTTLVDMEMVIELEDFSHQCLCKYFTPDTFWLSLEKCVPRKY